MMMELLGADWPAVFMLTEFVIHTTCLTTCFTLHLNLCQTYGYVHAFVCLSGCSLCPFDFFRLQSPPVVTQLSWNLHRSRALYFLRQYRLLSVSGLSSGV